MQVGRRVTLWRDGDQVMGSCRAAPTPRRSRCTNGCSWPRRPPRPLAARRRARGVPHRLGRPRAPRRADDRSLGAVPRRRIRRRDGSHPDREGHRGPHRRHLLGRQGRALPRPGCRRSPRAFTARLAVRRQGRRAGRVPTPSSMSSEARRSNRNLQAVAPKGSVVSGRDSWPAGRRRSTSGFLMPKRCRLIGTVLRARPIEEKIALTRRFAAELLPLFETGGLAPRDRLPLPADADRRRPPAHGVAMPTSARS